MRGARHLGSGPRRGGSLTRRAVLELHRGGSLTQHAVGAHEVGGGDTNFTLVSL